MLKAITREEILAHLNDGALRLVDVLPRESFRSGHIPGALSLPLAEIGEKAATILPDLSTPIVVYCGSVT